MPAPGECRAWTSSERGTRQQAGMVLAQLSERPASLMWRTLVIVGEVRCPAFAAIVHAPAHLLPFANEPDRIGAVAEGNADMTLGLQALGFISALADADRAAHRPRHAGQHIR